MRQHSTNYEPDEEKDDDELTEHKLHNYVRMSPMRTANSNSLSVIALFVLPTTTPILLLYYSV